MSKEHYPQHKKYFSEKERAVGMLIALSGGMGSARATKALSMNSIKEMAYMKRIDGLTQIQSDRVRGALQWTGRMMK
jgi:hypothetical protein